MIFKTILNIHTWTVFSGLRSVIVEVKLYWIQIYQINPIKRDMNGSHWENSDILNLSDNRLSVECLKKSPESI